MTKSCIVVTGLPACGKSTIGKQIADSLEFSFLDKDNYLERLYEERGVGNSSWRQTLSRESDSHFIRDAKSLESVVLVSHWRTKEGTDSGTPTEWLREYFTLVVELFCSCSTDIAASRFRRRERHPGHLDRQKSEESILAWMADYREGLPLRVGSLVVAETDNSPLLDDIIHKVRRNISVNT